jgi:RNase P subunit RPR2
MVKGGGMIRYGNLISRAEKLRERAERHLGHLNRLAEEERQLREDIEAQRSKVKGEQEYADKFQTELGQVRGPICPDCFVFERGKVSLLTPPDPEAEDFTYKCESCGYRVSLK